MMVWQERSVPGGPTMTLDSLRVRDIGGLRRAPSWGLGPILALGALVVTAAPAFAVPDLVPTITSSPRYVYGAHPYVGVKWTDSYYDDPVVTWCDAFYLSTDAVYDDPGERIVTVTVSPLSPSALGYSVDSLPIPDVPPGDYNLILVSNRSFSGSSCVVQPEPDVSNNVNSTPITV